MRKHTVIFLIPALTFIFCWTLMTDATEDEPGTLEYLELFSQCYELVQSRYLEPTDPTILAEGAVEGMLLESSPYASLIPKSGSSRLIPAYGPAQLGVVIGFRKPVIEVIDVLPGSIAEEKGLMAGDLIVKINDKVTPFLPVDRAARMLSGEAGDTVELLMQNHLTGEVDEIELEIKPVESRSGTDITVNDGIRRIQFSGELNIETLKTVLSQLTNSDNLPTILDLRHLNRGSETLGVQLADLFIKDGQEMLATCDAEENVLSLIPSRDGNNLSDFPLTVIIDRTSAGPGETCAAALQVTKRAVIIGDRSFGKAVLKENRELNEDYLLSLVTGWYCTPDGEIIHIKGLKPDIDVQLPASEGSDPYIETALAQFQAVHA